MSLAPDPVLLDVSPEGLAVVRINRHAKRNTIDELTVAALADAFETLKGADHVRVVFLRGVGDVFSEGADHEWLRRQAERNRDDNEIDALAVARMLKHLHDLPQFTVALIEGAAYGEAVGLAAACDWGVATSGARFRLPHVRHGANPAVLAPFLVDAMGPRAARALMASALPFDAEAALRYRLIDEIVPGVEELDAAMKRLAGLALENAPDAAAQAKAFALYASQHELDDRLLKEAAKRTGASAASGEAREGVAALLDRRAPEWKS
ncbi:MAG TPA: enoyl-CoA hydratase-related protein [Caulobacterales bacterium]|nr:enoyl-CoA hydratase-related protein [Caulobacterales bacterium]